MPAISGTPGGLTPLECGKTTRRGLSQRAPDGSLHREDHPLAHEGTLTHQQVIKSLQGRDTSRPPSKEGRGDRIRLFTPLLFTRLRHIRTPGKPVRFPPPSASRSSSVTAPVPLALSPRAEEQVLLLHHQWSRLFCGPTQQNIFAPGLPLTEEKGFEPGEVALTPRPATPSSSRRTRTSLV